MKKYRNLLPLQWRWRLLIRRRLRQWIPVWMLALVACLGTAAAFYSQQLRQQARCEQLQVEVDPILQVAAETDQLRIRLAVLEGRESLLSTLENASDPYCVLGIVSQSLGATSDRIRIKQYTMSTKQGVLPPPAAGTTSSEPLPAPEQEELLLLGNAEDDLSTTHLVNQLRSFGVFDEVVLQSSQVLDDEGTREFRINCLLEK